MNFKVSITETYPWNPWELFADPLEPAEHTFGITALRHCWCLYCWSSWCFFLPYSV